MGKHYIVLSGILIFIFLLVGCNNSEEKNTGKINFMGESEHWNAKIYEEYKETWTKGDKDRLEYNHSVKQTLELIYKGKDDEKPSYLNFECKGTFGSVGRKLRLEKNGKFSNIIYQGGNGSAIAREHDTFSLTIKWDKDKEEIIELKAR